MKNIFQAIILLLLSVSTYAQTLDDARNDIDNENYYKAKLVLWKLLGDVPNKAEVAYYLGNAYLKSDDADSARIFYKMVYSPDSRTALGYVANGRLSLLSKNSADAKQNFDKALQTTKFKNAGIYFEIGDAYFRPNVIDIQQAIANLKSAYELDAKNVTVILELGDAYLENSVNDPTGGGNAMNKYEQATGLNPNLAIAWIKQGRLAVRGHIWDQAIEAFNKALKIDPNNPLVHKELANVYYQTKQYDKMVQEFNSYLTLSPGDVKARTYMLNMYQNSGDYEKVIDEATKGLQKDPTNQDFMRYQFYADFQLKRIKDGYDAMKKFMQMPGAKIKPLDYTYGARLANGMVPPDTALSLTYYPMALAGDSDNCDLIGEYSKALYMARHYDEAISQYNRKKVKCNGIGNLDLYYLGRAYYAINDSINADSTFTEFVRRNPASPDGYIWMAKIMLKMGKLEDFLSFPYYQKYIELASTDPTKYKANLVEAYDYSGIYYMVKEKDKAKAKEYFNKGLELDPDDGIATDYLKQIK